MEIKIKKEIADLLVIAVYKDEKTSQIRYFNSQNEELKTQILKNLKILNFQGQEFETLYFNIKNQKVLLVALKKEYNNEDLRRTYSGVLRYLKSKKETKATFEIPKEDENELVAIIEGLELTDYSFDKYIKKDPNKKNEEFQIFLDIDFKYEKIIKELKVITDNVKITRNLVNENSDVMNPQKLEEIAKDFAKKNKLKIKVLNEKQIIKENLNLISAVGHGSMFPPRLIIIEYIPNPKSKEKLALIGKGITFDTGGINLKPTGYLEDMKSDMAGAATVFGVFKAAIELKLKQNMILCISAAENAISGKSYKPGDIIISYDKTTVEIKNTDAEGRLVLADAIGYVQKNYKPTSIIDIATLTGACLVALGPNMIAMLGNDDKIKKKIFDAGEKTFERVWELPIYDEHRDTLKSKFADIKNHGGKYGGTIAGAAFIEKFIEKDVKWVHLDIAGAACSLKEEYYVPEFGTGRGVRLMVEYLKNQ